MPANRSFVRTYLVSGLIPGMAAAYVRFPLEHPWWSALVYLVLTVVCVTAEILWILKVREPRRYRTESGPDIRQGR
jgi:hypothetical protein